MKHRPNYNLAQVGFGSNIAQNYMSYLLIIHMISWPKLKLGPVWVSYNIAQIICLTSKKSYLVITCKVDQIII